MPYRKKDNAFRKTIAFVVVAAVLAAAAIFLRRGTDKDGGRDVPVYGTPSDTGFVVVDEEIGVFEDPSAGDMVTMAPVEEDVAAETSAPEPRAAAEPAAQPATTPAASPAPAAAVRERAAAAIPRYQSELAKKRADPLLLNNYAWSLHQAGRYADAEETLREVIRIAPKRAIAYANLGESLWKQGKNEEAAAMYRKFLALNTDPRRERIAEAKVAAITGGEP